MRLLHGCSPRFLSVAMFPGQYEPLSLLEEFQNLSTQLAPGSELASDFWFSSFWPFPPPVDFSVAPAVTELPFWSVIQQIGRLNLLLILKSVRNLNPFSQIAAHLDQPSFPDAVCWHHWFPSARLESSPELFSFCVRQNYPVPAAAYWHRLLSAVLESSLESCSHSLLMFISRWFLLHDLSSH
ncbi:hypothetical protein HAX54_028043 [Datura stramonium]|uniref:Uncharacterized protein n=1 Tax=Datura stramonium TaxID=4076 RepID=A0ABS8S982_DATST|nr:hypothetical protein [Datura stramonium]